jgi:hypothetical protein
VKAHDYLRWPEFGRPQLFHERWEHRPPYGALVDVYHTARRIHEEEIADRLEPRARGILYRWPSLHELHDSHRVVAARPPLGVL